MGSQRVVTCPLFFSPRSGESLARPFAASTYQTRLRAHSDHVHSASLLRTLEAHGFARKGHAGVKSEYV